MKKITEDAYDAILEAVEKIDNVTNGYFPTVEDLENHNVNKDIVGNLFVLAYYASNPFQRLSLPEAEDADYKETVKYCRNLLYKFEPAV